MYLWAAYDQICRSTVSMSLFVAISKLKSFFEKVHFKMLYILLTYFHEKVESSTDNVKRVLLILEREAFMQRCLQMLAEKLATNIGLQEVYIIWIPY